MTGSSNGGMMRTIKIAGGALALLLVLLMVLGPIAGLIADHAGTHETFEPDAGTAYEVEGESEIPDGFEVSATTGYGIELTDGAYVGGIDSHGAMEGSWSVFATASVADGYENATMDIYAYDNETVLIQYQGGEWAAEYREDGQFAQTSIEAESPNTLTPLTATWDGEELTLWADGEASEPAQLSDDREPRQVAIGWEGVIDEVRLADYEVAEFQIANYAEDPIDPLSISHTARLMFDEGEGDTTEILYADEEAYLVDASWTEDGVEGPGLERGVDYELYENPLEIETLSDGYLDGAPVAVYSLPGNVWANLATGWFGMIGTVLTLLILGVLVMAAAKVVDEFGGGGFGGR